MTGTARLAETTRDRTRCCELARHAFEPDRPALAVAARRLGSLRRATAEWWMLEAEGEVVSTLLCYDLPFVTAAGERRGGFGFGGVATHPDHRRRGHAERLCREVVAACRERDRSVGLLFSAIPPAYYERQGWTACPAWDLVTDQLEALAEGGPRPELVGIDPRRSLGELCRSYDRFHAGELHLRRDRTDWEQSLALRPDDWWLGVGDPDRELRSVVRVVPDGRVLDLLEVLAEPGEEVPLLRALADFARRLDLVKMGCWLPPIAELADVFEDHGREKSLPMVQGVSDGETSQFWASDYF